MPVAGEEMMSRPVGFEEFIFRLPDIRLAGAELGSRKAAVSTDLPA